MQNPLLYPIMLTCVPHFSHCSTNIFPCSSERASLGYPDLTCKPSTFCVITYFTKPETSETNNNLLSLIYAIVTKQQIIYHHQI